MNRVLRFASILVGATAVITVAACTYTVSKYERAFEATSRGQEKEQVIGRFGAPSIREKDDAPFTRYAIRPCEAECAERVWWEHPVLKGIEAWSVEFDAQGKVTHTAHWVSP